MARTTTLDSRAVLVTRASEYDVLLARHGTRGQVRFFLESRGQGLDAVLRRHERQASAVAAVLGALPRSWRRAQVDRADLDRFLFEPGDIVATVGQDGLVANVAKYLDGQAVLGFNPDPAEIDGVLARLDPREASRAFAETAGGSTAFEERVMVEARLGDGQRVLALNELFVGQRTHQSARYRISFGGAEERQSSSGLIVATGTGATGWARSICRELRDPLELPSPVDAAVAFLVREAWPSVATGTGLTRGLVGPDALLRLVSEMDGGVVFGDGIESDAIEFPYGSVLDVRPAERRLRLAI